MRVVDGRPFLNRFWAKISKELGQGPDGDCWQWIGAKDSAGYGTLGVAGRQMSAHRIAFALGSGQAPGEKFVCHYFSEERAMRPNAKLSNADAKDICEKVLTMGRSKKSVARDYGVTDTTINRVVKQHLDGRSTVARPFQTCQ